jgi:hypothetical protein
MEQLDQLEPQGKLAPQDLGRLGQQELLDQPEPPVKPGPRDGLGQQEPKVT